MDEVRQLQALLAARTGQWLPPGVEGSEMTRDNRGRKRMQASPAAAPAAASTKGTGGDQAPKPKVANKISAFDNSPAFKSAKAVQKQIKSALKAQNAKRLWDLKDTGLLGQHLKAQADLSALKMRSRKAKAKATGTSQEILDSSPYMHTTLAPFSREEVAETRAKLASQGGMLLRRCGGYDKVMANDDACKAFIGLLESRHRIDRKSMEDAPSLKGDDAANPGSVPNPDSMETDEVQQNAGPSAPASTGSPSLKGKRRKRRKKSE